MASANYLGELKEAQRKFRNIGRIIDRSGAYVNSTTPWPVKPYHESKDGGVDIVGTLASIGPVTGGGILFGGRGGGKTETAQTSVYGGTGKTPEQVQKATYSGRGSEGGNGYSMTEERTIDTRTEKRSKEDPKEIQQKLKGTETSRFVLTPSDFIKSQARIFDELGELSQSQQIESRRLLAEGTKEMADGTIYRVPLPWYNLATTNSGIAETISGKNIDIALLDRFPFAVEVPQGGGFVDRYSLGARPFQRVFETDILKALRDMGYPTTSRENLLPSSMEELGKIIALVDRIPVEDDLRYFADFLLAANSLCVRGTFGDKRSGTKPIGDRSETYRCFECPYNGPEALSKMLTEGFSYRTMQHLLRLTRAATFYLDPLEKEPVAKLETGESVAPFVLVHRMLPTSVAAESTASDSRTGLAYLLTQRAANEYNSVQPVINAMIRGMNGSEDLRANADIRDALRRVGEVERAEAERRAGKIEHPVSGMSTGDLVTQFLYAPVLRDLTEPQRADVFRKLVEGIEKADTNDKTSLQKAEDEINYGTGKVLSLASRSHIKRNVLYPKFGVNEWMVA